MSPTAAYLRRRYLRLSIDREELMEELECSQRALAVALHTPMELAHQRAVDRARLALKDWLASPAGLEWAELQDLLG